MALTKFEFASDVGTDDGTVVLISTKLEVIILSKLFYNAILIKFACEQHLSEYLLLNISYLISYLT